VKPIGNHFLCEKCIQKCFTCRDCQKTYHDLDLKIIDKNIAFIETWIMSCRVLKRTVENLVMNQIVNKLRELKIGLLL
jgi:hypothetical protein